MSDSITVRVVDPDTDEVLDEATITDDYIIVTDGRCHVAHTAVHTNGTHVVTIKNAKRSPRA